MTQPVALQTLIFIAAREVATLIFNITMVPAMTSNNFH